MVYTNLHLFLSTIQNETRLVKEARATLAMGVFSRVRVLGLWEPGLPISDSLPGGLEVSRVRTALRVARAHFRGVPPAGIAKLLAFFSYAQYAVAAIWEAIRIRPSHVTCHNLMLLPVSWLAAKVSGSALVYAPHELEVERAGLSGRMKRVAVPIERTFIRGCSAVVVVCDPIADWYRARYGVGNVYVVRAIPEAQPLAESGEHRARIREGHKVPEDVLLFIYQGVLAKERGVDGLLQAFGEPGLRCHLMLMGYGEAVGRIKAAAAKCERIHFQAAVPVDQIIQYSAAADVGVFVMEDPLPLSYQLCLPNKFFEYLHAGLPVIVSNNLCLLTRITREHGLGWITNTHELVQLVKSFDQAEVGKVRPAVAAFVAKNTWDTERAHYRAVYTRL